MDKRPLLCRAVPLAIVLVAVLLVLSCPAPNGGPDGDGDDGDDEPTWPDIALSMVTGAYSQTSIDPGAAADAGVVLEHAGRDLAFRISNVGFGPLSLTGTPCVAISGADAPHFSVLRDPATSIAAGESSDVPVRVSPDGSGPISAIISIESNDPDQGLFTFTITASVTAPPAAIPATGQTTSYVPGDDGDLEAGVAWPTPRFADNGDGTTTDHLTGLMWASTAGSATTQWEGALSAANGSTLGGHDDWRLPNVNELMSLVNLGQPAPNSWLNGLPEFSGIQSGRYWASTIIYQPTTLWGWVAHMNNGILGRTNISAIPTSYAWLVRNAETGVVALPRTGKSGLYSDGDDGDLQAGVAWPVPRFVRNGDAMVLDMLTGLIWHQSPSETTMSWEDAFAYAAGLDTGGYTDWRVPNRSELRSLANYNYYNWDLYLSGDFGVTVPAGEYWSSSTYAPETADAWVVIIQSGHAGNATKTQSLLVWAVRGGRPH